MEQKRPADIIQELLDYLWNGLGLEEKGWKRLKKGDFKTALPCITGIDDDIHVGAVHQVFQDAKLLFGTSRHQIFIIYLFVLRSTAI